MVSNKCVGGCPNRSFSRLSLALKEIIDPGCGAGSTSAPRNVQGSVLGKKVVHFLDRHYFQPGSEVRHRRWGSSGEPHPRRPGWMIVNADGTGLPEPIEELEVQNWSSGG